MEHVNNENVVYIKSEQVCRTCLIDEGHFFNISDTFDHYTLTQMIQNITNLQIHPTDGYTNSICEYCVREVRRANKFRTKCLESNNVLINVEIKTVEIPISVCKTESLKVEEIKQEAKESCYIADNNLETEDDCKSDEPVVESDSEDNEELDDENKEHAKYLNKTSSLNIIFDCPLCHGLFTSDNVYQKHIKEFHLDRINDERFKKEPQPLGIIVKRKTMKRLQNAYKCVTDDFIGDTFVEFRNHMKEHMGEKPVVCVECEFRTTEISLLKKHTGEKKFSCTLCNYSCKTQRSLNSHLPTHSNEKKFKCKLCPMTFKFESCVSVHKMKVHEKRKSYVCSFCQKDFFFVTALKQHIRIHTGERPYICNYCGKRFAMAGLFKNHIKLHEPPKTIFKCDLCDYSTNIKSYLRLHIQKHSGEKYFYCNQCPFSSLRNSALKVHMMRHSGLKRFACDLCDYKTVGSSDLKKHRIKHSREKPFQCTICDYRCGLKQALSRHLQTHSTEQKFECPNCPYKTNVRDILTKHMKRNCVVLKRGRRPSKLQNKEDTESQSVYYSL